MKHPARRLALAALLLAGPAAAQAPTGSAPPPDPALCEFHVWPSEALMTVYYGWLHGSTVNGLLLGRPGYPRVPPNPVDFDAQRAILTEARPHFLLGQPDHRLIIHDSALDSRTIRTTEGRFAASASPCYAELVVDDVILQQGVAGTTLKMLFRYRDFGPDQRPRRSFATFADTDLHVFPPTRPDQLDAALAEIRGAYRQNIDRFAAAAMRPPRRRH